MPMVPTSFVPAVTQTPSGDRPVSAPAVEPERNYAPQQIEQMGNAMSRAGAVALQTGQSISDRVFDQINDARTKQAETVFLQQSMDILHNPKSGYLNTKGATAQDQYDAATQALAKAKQSAEDSLTNPVQKFMFRQAATQHMVSFGTAMADHRFQQVSQYSAKEADDRADNYVLMAANAYQTRNLVDAEGKPTGDFVKYANAAIAEAQNAAQVGLGAAPDSAAAKALVREKTTAIAQGVITRLMDNHAFSEAKTFYDDQLAKGNIDERQAEALGNAIKSNLDRETIVTEVNKQMDSVLNKKAGTAGPNFELPVQGGSITSVLGEPRPGGRTHDGIDIAVPPNTKVIAPADGTVTKVWNDDKFGGGLSMEITHPDGTITGYAHLNATNYQPGQQVSQGQVIALTGKSGNATGPSLHYTMIDPQGQHIDPRSAGGAPVDRTQFVDPNDLKTVVDNITNSDYDPYMKREMITYAESQQRRFRVIQNEDYQQNRQNAIDQWYTAGGDYTKIDPSLWGKLKPSDQYDLKQGLPQKSDEATLLDLIMLPPNQLTPAYVKSKQPQLSQSDFLSWTERAVRLQNSPDTVRSVSLDRDQLNTTLLKNDLQKLVNPKAGSDDAAMTIQLRTHIDDEIDAAQRATGKELTRDQKQQIIDRNIMDQVHLPGWFFGMGGKDVMTEFATPEQLGRAVVKLDNGETVRIAQIPANVRQGIISRLQTRNIPVTQKEIARQWVLAGKPGAVQ